jgi:hypothetical protein
MADNDDNKGRRLAEFKDGAAMENSAKRKLMS